MDIPRIYVILATVSFQIYKTNYHEKILSNDGLHGSHLLVVKQLFHADRA